MNPDGGIVLLILYPIVLVGAIIFGHDFGELFEKGLTLMGSAFVIFGHIQNYRLCKQLECSDSECAN